MVTALESEKKAQCLLHFFLLHLSVKLVFLSRLSQAQSELAGFKWRLHTKGGNGKTNQAKEATG